MIEKIVLNTKKHIFETPENIAEKLKYFKEISNTGLEIYSTEELEKIQSDFNKFLNINLTLFAEIEPTKLFRITRNKLLYKENPYKLQKISDLMGPPIEFANIGRVNKKGESVFYCALDFSTAVWEMQPEVGEYITVSEWKIKEGQKLINHFIFHPEETNLSEDSQKAQQAHLKEMGVIRDDYKKIFIEISRFIAEEFMKPVDRAKNANYLFSSLIGSRFLQEEKDANGFKIESISYPSTRRDCEVTNLAILNSLVLEKLDLVSATIMTVAETNYDLENKYRKDLILVSALQTESESFDFENNKIYWNLKKELEDGIRLYQEMEDKKLK
ncbi:hypothetical protein DRF62_04120 [Chryseobacterium piscium]|uniref:RES domain-containing protein n=1 Tax=Chryseobacterium piscium TaxID=333702 RepID=A0A3D9BRW0_9FLAO|nr:RES domain-containing protein [Chryseobacterium piscium]REC56258.1 hypothetical protein DRF62_04120 [Chryseobacterium piscium]